MPTHTHHPLLELSLLDELIELGAEFLDLDPCCSVPCSRCGCTHYHRSEVSLTCDYCGMIDELESAEDDFEELDFDFEGCYVR
jgi:hypothetical protein